MTDQKLRKPVSSVDGIAKRPTIHPEEPKSKSRLPELKISEVNIKALVIVVVVLVLGLFGWRLLQVDDSSQIADEDMAVASATDSPLDEQRKEDLERLKVAIQNYFATNNELPTPVVITSSAFISEHLGDFLHPDGTREYAISTYSTSEYIIGYAAGTLCLDEIGGTVPSSEVGAFSLHIITEDGLLHCIDSTTP